MIEIHVRSHPEVPTSGSFTFKVAEKCNTKKTLHWRNIVDQEEQEIAGSIIEAYFLNLRNYPCEGSADVHITEGKSEVRGAVCFFGPERDFVRARSTVERIYQSVHDFAVRFPKSVFSLTWEQNFQVTTVSPVAQH